MSSGASPEAGPARKRVSKACDGCYARRHKCDGMNPCQRCLETGIDCRYDRVARKRGPQGPGKRAKTAESQMPHIKEEEQATSGAASPAFAPSGFFSSAPASMGSMSMVPSAPAPNPLQFLSLGLGRDAPNPRTLLPPPPILKKLVAAFFNHVHPFIQIIHRHSFLEDLSAQSPLLLLSVCGSLSGRAIPELDAEAEAHAERCLEAGYGLIIPSMISPEPVSLDVVLASLHFDHAAGNRSNPHIVDRWLGFSIASMMQRGLNVEADFGTDLVKREQGRRAWWRLYSYERASAMQAGRICLISEDANLLRLPVSDVVWGMPTNQGASAMAAAPPRFLPGSIERSLAALQAGELRGWNPLEQTLFLLSTYGHVNRVVLGLRDADWGTAASSPSPLMRILEEQRHSLLKVLDLLWEGLDEPVKRLDEDPMRFAKEASYVDGRWSWIGAEDDPMTLCMLILYRTLRILLVSPPDLSRMISTQGWLFSPDFIAAVHHAGAISRLLEAVMATNQDLNFVHPCLGFCVVTAASVHVALVRALRMVPARPALPGPSDTDQGHMVALVQVQAQALRDVEVNIRALEGLGKRWKLAAKTGRALRQALEVMDWDGLEVELGSIRRLAGAGKGTGADRSVIGDGGPNANGAEDVEEEQSTRNTEGFALKVLADLAEAQMRSKAMEAAEAERVEGRTGSFASERAAFGSLDETFQESRSPAANSAMPVGSLLAQQSARQGLWIGDPRPGSSVMPTVANPAMRGLFNQGLSPLSVPSPGFSGAATPEQTASVPSGLPAQSFFPNAEGIDSWPTGNGQAAPFQQDDLAMLFSGVGGNTDIIFWQ
ncbi:hypothetical protein DFJ74DRAFT_690891 [Hyaloraphidium curvatum]|nr:hypothetical protein DFJ74DRAFT_690891 [Hyaloraphidium curvatum]